MKKPLLGRKVAVLVANGFSEKDLTLTQKALVSAGAALRIISMDQGLVNSWNDDDGDGGQEGWGLNFAADQVLNRALAADYDMLIVPGGRRSVEKLELTAHTRRFIGGFVDSGKPVAIYNDALALLMFAERAGGFCVAGPESLRQNAEAQGADWSDTSYSVSGCVVTGLSDGQTRADYVDVVSEFLVAKVLEEEKLSEAVAA
ncbi:MAG: DJ-1/PfpI family protein [Alphaproteobacteria bacterium]